MTTEPSKSFPLPWNQSAHYWLCLLPASELADDALAALAALGFARIAGATPIYVAQAPRQWGPVFERATAALGAHIGSARAAIIADGDTPPSADTVQAQARPASDVAFIARSLWLGEVLREQRIRSYMQPVMDKRGKVFGHEAFARALWPEGEVVGGGKIIEASRDLNIEHLLDRYLQVHAIRTFIESDLGGCLFINFTPGFIHRPEVYLEGLSDTVKRYALPPKHVVLDVTRAETPRDPQHLKAIFEYCRAKGYATSMDDVSSVEIAGRLIADAHPDFIKLDIGLVRNAGQAASFETITSLVQIAHQSGCTVIAEGVETEAVHTALLRAGVDLFQGYLFSPPIASNPPTVAQKHH